MIVSSFQSQYGIRLSRDLRGMKWNEFSSLLMGLDSKTALGRVVSIRAEEDPEILKCFTKHENKIRNDWRKKQAKNKSQEELVNVLDEIKDAFLSMAGGVNG